MLQTKLNNVLFSDLVSTNIIQKNVNEIFEVKIS